jgi:hypothetical protein
LGRLEAEFMFIALDREEDVRKLLSLELTGAFANELREIPKSIVDALSVGSGAIPRCVAAALRGTGSLLTRIHQTQRVGSIGC